MAASRRGSGASRRKRWENFGYNGGKPDRLNGCAVVGLQGPMRVACLDLPGFPLQLVWRQEPAWRTQPVVVIENDRPQGEVLWACERARAMGVLAGQRYAYALSLCGGLRAR